MECTVPASADNPTAMERMLHALADGIRVIDLAHPLSESTPFSPNSPGYRRSLLRRHGDVSMEPDVSFATDILATGTHVGTHIDAISHISHGGKLHGGHDADDAQRGGGFRIHDIHSLPPIVARGVLLDVARLHEVDVLPAGYGINGDDLGRAAERAGVEVQEGDVVLVRSGWSVHFGDPETFVGLRDGAPGVTESGADWLIDHRVRATGGETIAYEQIAPGAGHARMPVHRRLLFDEAIPIIEVLDLRTLAGVAAAPFLFVLTPLPLVGATGSPARPIAIVD
jgi:kynurenine formamidase